MNLVFCKFTKKIFIYLFFVIQLINLPSTVSSSYPLIPTISRLVSTTKGELEAGNYSHYSLQDRGNFRIVLTSLEGDADLYASDKHNIVDSSNYEWQSLTYGEDEIFISENMQRPVAISVFAHPYYVKSVYVLKTYQIQMSDKSYETMNTNSFENLNSNYPDEKYSFSNTDFDEQHEMNLNHQEQIDNDEESESIVWKIFISLLKIIADVVLS